MAGRHPPQRERPDRRAAGGGGCCGTPLYVQPAHRRRYAAASPGHDDPVCAPVVGTGDPGMINPPHLGIEWLDALRVLLPHIIVVISVGFLIALPWLLRNEVDDVID